MPGTRIVFVSLSLCAFCDSARTEFEYDYLDVRYEYIEMNVHDVFGDSTLLTADGYGIDFSHDYENNLILAASLYRTDFGTVEGVSTTQDSFKIGAGYHHSFNDFYDVYGILSYVGVNTEFSDGSMSNDGFEAIAGLRVWPNDVLELNGFLQFSDYDDPLEQTLSELSVGGHARWYLNDTLSLGLGASIGENTSAYFGTVRMSFESLPFGL